jgi:uncharacterized low-complexity protein
VCLFEHGSVPSFWRPNSTSLTSARPWTLSKASATDMADVTDDTAKTAASSCEGLMVSTCEGRGLCGEWSRTEDLMLREPTDTGEESCRASWGQ